MNTDHDFKGKTGIRRIINAFYYSLAGLRRAWTSEAAFRQEVLLATPLILIAIWLDVSLQAKALLIGSVLLILITELLNSAIEAIVDKTTPEIHELAGAAKDMGSAAVLIALVNCLVIWLLVLLQEFNS